MSEDVHSAIADKRILESSIASQMDPIPASMFDCVATVRTRRCEITLHDDITLRINESQFEGDRGTAYTTLVLVGPKSDALEAEYQTLQKVLPISPVRSNIVEFLCRTGHLTGGAKVWPHLCAGSFGAPSAMATQVLDMVRDLISYRLLFDYRDSLTEGYLRMPLIKFDYNYGTEDSSAADQVETSVDPLEERAVRWMNWMTK